jgi:ABC-type nitrate/sulfonate/bicarbonate transport system substrate-binding protein
MKSGKRIAITLIIIIIAVTLILSSFLYLNLTKPYDGEIESITVAYSPFESVTLFWIAENQNFFSHNGLNVTSQMHATGAGALDGVLSGEADIVVGTTEFPFASRVLNQARISTIASMSKSEFIYLVGRVDRGINDVSDLKGKTIGTTRGSIAHFYLGRFLELNSLSFQDVAFVDLKTPTEWVDAVVNGSIDAVVTAQPYVEMAKEGLGANAIVWSIQSNQPLYSQVISTDEWITGHPELCNRFLKSLYQAEAFVINHPAEAKEIVKNQMNFSDSYVETVWHQNQFSLSLDQSLILAMEGEARWLISNKLTNSKAVPNFLDYIYLDGLETVKPEAVNIIH